MKHYTSREDYIKARNVRASKFVSEKTTRICLCLNNNTDDDMITYLRTLDNRQGYIKELIREDIAEKN